ncbi:MAG: hypothetical protein L0206_16025, partial [Actinobacteria bacterium]|nr:hypothetical protein [Actinomycetota bacterium]
VSIAAQDAFIVYEVDEGVVGNQDYGGSLGLDFDVNAHGRVTRLGVFDSGSAGLARTITARLFNRDTQEELAMLEFTAAAPGDLVGGSRFKALDEPVFLTSGFHGTISAEGYGAGELNGNQGVGPVAGLSTHPGPENEISFVGGGRFGDAGAFPANPDGGPVNRYAAGTFEFRPALIAYDVPAGTAGNQEYGGALGHDFNVKAEILITRLGVFDSGSDGLVVPITARIFDRDTETEITSLEFTPEDPGDQVGGSRFKNLPEPLSLPVGFHGTVSANGYGAGEPNGNQGVGPLSGLATDDGPCSIEFVGGGRFGDAATPAAFPGSPDGGPANRYAAGTFEYEAVGVVEKGGIAYVVPSGTAGGQAFGGSLGMDFDVLEDIEITRLGVFDSGSDGLGATITAQVFSR